MEQNTRQISLLLPRYVNDALFIRIYLNLTALQFKTDGNAVQQTMNEFLTMAGLIHVC